jgi:hypothetical protein
MDKRGRDDIKQCYMYDIDSFDQLVSVIVDNCYTSEDKQTTDAHIEEVRSWIDEFIFAFVKIE